MKYFAYGSNMLEEWLRARAPSAIFLSTGFVPGWTLRFEKRSVDGSGKCNIAPSETPADIAYGVVFELPDTELPALDRAEGVGHGYHRDYNVPVTFPDGHVEKILAYIADPDAIDRNLKPYCWYQALVVAGAEQHGLPPNYIARLRAFSCNDDPNPNRATKLEADRALAAYRAHP